MSDVGDANGYLMCKYTSGMLKVLMAAGDTFRAAAGEQLEVWAQRTGSEIVMPEAGVKARPAAGTTSGKISGLLIFTLFCFVVNDFGLIHIDHHAQCCPRLSSGV